MRARQSNNFLYCTINVAFASQTSLEASGESSQNSQRNRSLISGEVLRKYHTVYIFKQKESDFTETYVFYNPLSIYSQILGCR